MIRTISLIAILVSGQAWSKPVSLFDEIGLASGVKPIVLYGMSLHESSPVGYDRPWPWAVNIAGKSYWFNTKQEAIRAAVYARKSGIKNIDVGLMQVSLKWHGDKFASIEEAFDPKTNLKVAAGIMKGFLRKHSLFDAIGKYHCPGEVAWCRKAANDYAIEVVGRLKGLE